MFRKEVNLAALDGVAEVMLELTAEEESVALANAEALSKLPPPPPSLLQAAIARIAKIEAALIAAKIAIPEG